MRAGYTSPRRVVEETPPVEEAYLPGSHRDLLVVISGFGPVTSRLGDKAMEDMRAERCSDGRQAGRRAQ